MIKVLHFFKTYYPETMGGIEQVIFQIAEGGIRHGFESEVLYLSERGAARNEPVGHHLTHRSKLDLHVASTGFSLSAFKDFAELAQKADIVHYHFPWPYMDLVHFVSRIRKPAVVSYHSDIVKQKTLLKLYQPLMNRFLSSVDCIVASSPNYAESSPVLTRFKDKVHVVPYGLDRQTYPRPLLKSWASGARVWGSAFSCLWELCATIKGWTICLKLQKTLNCPSSFWGADTLKWS